MKKSTISLVMTGAVLAGFSIAAPAEASRESDAATRLAYQIMVQQAADRQNQLLIQQQQTAAWHAANQQYAIMNGAYGPVGLYGGYYGGPRHMKHHKHHFGRFINGCNH